MTLDATLIVYGALFLAVLLGVEGVFLLLARRRSASAAVINRRLALLDSGMSTVDVAQLLRREKPIGAPSQAATRHPLAWLDRLADRAGLKVTTAKLLLAMTLAAVLVFAMLLATAGQMLIAVAGALGIGYLLPLAMLRIACARRVRRFESQLPDALDMVVRSLRAGHPVSAALKLVSEQMPDPIGSELGLVVDEMTYGLELREALENLAQRSGSDDMAFAVVAIKVQHRSGGNLADILGGLARVMRERARMYGKIKAISAEGRASAWVISGLPFFVGGAISVLNPLYYAEVSGDPVFSLGFAWAAVMGGTGIVVIFRMVNFKV